VRSTGRSAASRRVIPRASKTTLQHVSVEVEPAKVADCVAFYGLLGFEPVDPPPALRERAAWVERAGTQIHLMRQDDPVVMPHGHVALVVDDYDAALERLRAAGFDPEPREQHWGAPRSFVRDPAGTRVELMAAPPA
jgi:catechol 2,3-dioxygenase-like lactoylglutathione lyase family enzyme